MDSYDSILIKRLEDIIEENPEYWDFKEARKDHIHGIFTYPATMVPAMQSEILRILLEIKPEINSLLDPFMGSGTMPVEGMMNNLNVYGIDINPLSYLLTSVKINIPIKKKLVESKEMLFNFLNENKKYPIIEFKNINKWYKEEFITELSMINYCIRSLPEREVRNFFWLCLGEVTRLCNNSRNSTFKLHIKEKEDIEKFNYDIIKNIKKIVENNINRVDEYIRINPNLYESDGVIYSYEKERNIYLGNSIEVLKDKFDDNSIDLIITSPPYGDNQTTVTYGQFSILPLRWIDLNDIGTKFNKDFIDIDSKIDSSSLGGKKYSLETIENSNILLDTDTLNKFYNKLILAEESSKARKVASFILDFKKIMYELARILKKGGYMILTVGNRKVNGKEVQFNDIIKEICQEYNLELIYEFNRNILCKRIPQRVSKLKDKSSVKSMSKEYILIIKKEL